MGKIKSVMSVTGAALLLVLLGANAAHADPPPPPNESNVIDLGNEGITPLDTCTKIGPVELCGRITNSSSSDDDLWIIDNWPPNTANGAFMPPGQTSTRYFKDTDGVYIPTGCKGVRSLAPDLDGGYWYKISDGQHWTINLQC